MTGSARVVLDGSWEKPGKTPLTAAFAVVLICGALYYLAGSLVIAAVTFVSAIGGAAPMRGGLLAERIGEYNRRFQLPIIMTLVVTQLPLLLALPVALVRRWHTRQVTRYLGYTRPRVADLLLGALGAVALVPAAVLATDWVYRVLPELRELQRAGGELLAAPSPARLAVVLVGIAVTPAVCEEALFRGYFQSTLRRRLGPAASIAVSAAVFAFFHEDTVGLPALVLGGVYLGFLYESSGSLYTSMVAHFTYNAGAIVLANAPADLPILTSGGEEIAFSIEAAGVLVLAWVVWIMARRRRARGTGSP